MEAVINRGWLKMLFLKLLQKTKIFNLSNCVNIYIIA